MADTSSLKIGWKGQTSCFRPKKGDQGHEIRKNLIKSCFFKNIFVILAANCLPTNDLLHCLL